MTTDRQTFVALRDFGSQETVGEPVLNTAPATDRVGFGQSASERDRSIR
jgi:hypothetical protein